MARRVRTHRRTSGSPLPSCALIFVMPALHSKTAGQAAWQPDPDAFPVECLSPICDPSCHRVKAESLSGLVNQSSLVRMVYRSCGACRARGGADLRRGSHRRACGDAGRGHRLYRQQRASTPCSHEAAPIRPERWLWSQEAFNAVSRQPIN